MPLLDVMRSYVCGEALEGWLVILPSRLFLIAPGGALLRRQRTAFDWGLGVPCIVFGPIFVGEATMARFAEVLARSAIAARSLSVTH